MRRRISRAAKWLVALAIGVATWGQPIAVTAAEHRVQVVCHRGANEVAPENTRAAAQQCIDWGVDYVEVDVRTSKDGVLYILHDAKVDRTTDGEGLIAQMTSEEIDKLDAGGWFDPKFVGERVPRLEPYLEWIKGKAKVYFDVKACDIKQLVDLVYAVGMEKDCFFWFDNAKKAEEFRKLDQKLPLKVNVKNAAEVANVYDKLAANIVEVGVAQLSPELKDACKERGIEVMVLQTKKDPEAFRKIVEWEADLVNLDHADAFLAVQREVVGAAK
jgi:glycerophosphoryl diester phosphodiesterase